VPPGWLPAHGRIRTLADRVRPDLLARSLPLTAPLATAAGTVRTRMVWVVRISHDGLIGVGEAAPLPGFGGESPGACAEALLAAVELLTPEFISGWINRGRTDAPLGEVEKVLAHAPCARSAVEGALLDLLAQAGGVPVAELLNPDFTPWVPVNALLGATDGDDLAHALVAGGFGTLKLKLLGEVAEDAARLRSLRSHLGPDVRLRVDANGRWTLDQAAAFAAAVADLNLEYCEQPLPADDLAGMAQLRRRTRLPIAADESIRNATDVGRVAAAQAADVVVLKPMFLGGWRPTRQAVQVARSCGMEVVLTTALDGAIGRAHATHIAAALGLEGRAQGLATGELLAEDLTTEPLAMSGGDIAIHNRPGLGIGGMKG